MNGFGDSNRITNNFWHNPKYNGFDDLTFKLEINGKQIAEQPKPLAEMTERAGEPIHTDNMVIEEEALISGSSKDHNSSKQYAS